MISFGWAVGRPVCGCVWIRRKFVSSQLRAASFIYFGKCYVVHINVKCYRPNESVYRKKQHTCGNNTIPYKLATLMTFETLKWRYTFATNVLIVTRGESPLSSPLRNIVISGHVISGQSRFGTAQLHYFKLLCTGGSHGKSVQEPIRLKFVTIYSV